jgi:hypothetical protein
MKHKIKFVFLGILSLTSFECISQTRKQIDVQIMEYLKKERFNIEITDLSFCIDEILFVIEKDTSYKNIFIKRINESFDKGLSNATIYVHKKVFESFMDTIKSLKYFKNNYPKAYEYIIHINPFIKEITFNSFTDVFKAYIEYPEQVDDICVFTLLYKSDNKTYEGIEKDKVALWRFNTWIEYGFEEFRYYPGILNKAKGKINERIIEAIIRKQGINSNQLVKKSLEMIKNVEKKYTSPK